MKRLVCITVVLLMIVFGTVALAGWFPNQGDFYYNGGNYADSYLQWTAPGGFSHGDVGYEHDLDVSSTWANVCTSWTNLPSGYDDCPTMNVSEPTPGRATASFGSYHINAVPANTYYTGNWTLQRRDCGNCFVHDPVGSTTAKVKSEEVQHWFCPWDGIECMNGIRSAFLLVDLPLSVGTAYYEPWAY